MDVQYPPYGNEKKKHIWHQPDFNRGLDYYFFFNEWNEFDFIGSIRSIGENVELVIDPVFVSQ